MSSQPRIVALPEGFIAIERPQTRMLPFRQWSLVDSEGQPVGPFFDSIYEVRAFLDAVLEDPPTVDEPKRRG